MHADDPVDSEPTVAHERTFHTSFDPEERPSEVIVTAVSAITDTDPAALPALYESIDPDAVDALFRHAHRTVESPAHRLSFEYNGFDVRVRSDGAVRLERIDP